MIYKPTKCSKGISPSGSEFQQVHKSQLPMADLIDIVIAIQIRPPKTTNKPTKHPACSTYDIVSVEDNSHAIRIISVDELKYRSPYNFETRSICKRIC